MSIFNTSEILKVIDKQNKPKELTGGLVMGYDFSEGLDNSMLTVGTLNGDTVDVINFFRDEEAVEVYNLLTTYNGEEK